MIYGLRRDLAVGNRLQELAMFSPTSFRQIISDRILIALFIEDSRGDTMVG
ncbi:MAG: hypothetical protein ACLQNE_11250 [Thermoguttaceae bacterium]